MSPDRVDRPATAPARRVKVRLLWTLLAVLMVTALVPLWLTSYKLMGINRESLESASREYQLGVAASLARELDASTQAAQNILLATAHSLGSRIENRSGWRTPGGDDRLAPYLAGDLLALRYTSREGAVLESGDHALLKQGPVDRALFEAFATAVGGESFTGRPIQREDGKRPCVVVAVPVTVSGAVQGALAGIVDLSSPWMRGVASISSQYMTFALDDTGALFAQAGMPETLLDADAYKKLEIVTRFRRQGGGVIEILPFDAVEGSKTKELLGARATTDRGWGVFMMVDRELAYASVAEMRRSALQWALFAVLLAVAAAFVFAGAITRPIKILLENTRRLAAGDFGARAEVRSANEIGELAETFDFMAEEIRHYIERIKRAAEENNALFLGTIKALAAAIDEKDPYTRGHSERVHRYSVAIARHLGLSKEEIRNVTVGALLHDVGKIGIEDAILRKPAALSDKEFEIMKRHPLKGAHILGEMPQMVDVLPAMRNHHERWAGGGYPDGLKGEEIPMIARVVQVADTFDAMTTNRPYQRAMRMDAAVARVNELSGIVFDPKVVGAFKAAWIAGDLRLEEAAAQTSTT